MIAIKNLRIRQHSNQKLVSDLTVTDIANKRKFRVSNLTIQKNSLIHKNILPTSE